MQDRNPTALLPQEIILLIYSFLTDIKDLTTLLLVSKQLSSLADSKDNWKQLYFTFYSNDGNDGIPPTDTTESTVDYKKCFRDGLAAIRNVKPGVELPFYQTYAFLLIQKRHITLAEFQRYLEGLGSARQQNCLKATLSNGFTLLHHAAALGKADIARYLCKFIDNYFISQYGNPLEVAIRLGQTSVVALFFNELRMKQVTETWFVTAISSSSIECVRFLLQNGYHVFLRTNKDTALGKVIANLDAEMFTLLIEWGAQITLNNLLNIFKLEDRSPHLQREAKKVALYQTLFSLMKQEKISLTREACQQTIFLADNYSAYHTFKSYFQLEHSPLEELALLAQAGSFHIFREVLLYLRDNQPEILRDISLERYGQLLYECIAHYLNPLSRSPKDILPSVQVLLDLKDIKDINLIKNPSTDDTFFHLACYQIRMHIELGNYEMSGQIEEDWTWVKNIVYFFMERGADIHLLNDKKESPFSVSEYGTQLQMYAFQAQRQPQIKKEMDELKAENERLRSVISSQQKQIDTLMADIPTPKKEKKRKHEDSREKEVDNPVVDSSKRQCLGTHALPSLTQTASNFYQLSTENASTLPANPNTLHP